MNRIRKAKRMEKAVLLRETYRVHYHPRRFREFIADGGYDATD